MAYCQIDTVTSGKYDITREDYESKCNILRSQFADFPRLLRKSFYHSEHVRSFFLEQVQEAQPAVIFLSPGQTIATCQHNILQHCWAQHVACVWMPCCDMLPVVGSSLKMVKFKPATPNNVATCCVDMLRLFGRSFSVLRESIVV